MKIKLSFAVILLIHGFCLAQFDKKTIRIGGSLSWEQTYYDFEDEGISVFSIKPEAEYFFFKNISLLTSMQTFIYTYPKGWGGSTDTDFGFGLGGKYYYKYFYGGISYQFKQWNNIKPREHMLFELGYLFKLNQKIYLDMGLDILQGVSSLNYKNTKAKIDIGIAAFL